MRECAPIVLFVYNRAIHTPQEAAERIILLRSLICNKCKVGIRTVVSSCVIEEKSTVVGSPIRICKHIKNNE